MQRYIMDSDNIHFMPQEDLTKSWNLDDLLKLIEEWFMERELDVILLDHLQFAFEGAESIKGENEYASQRVFMQRLNQMIKRVKKTIILVSHINKNAQLKGMGKIVGSGAIAQAGTKVIEVSEDDMDFCLRLYMRKSRFTQRRDYHFVMKLKDGQLRSATS
jgi:predicted ATP-dependent serine protease